MAGDGEEGVTLRDADGNPVKNGIQRSDDDNKENTNKITDDNKKSESDNSKIDDVWGIKQSNMDYSDYVNIDTLGGTYSGITPLETCL